MVDFRSFYGAISLFDRIGEGTGVTEDLKSCFPDSYRQILSIAYCLILEAKNPLSRFPHWAAPYTSILMVMSFLPKEAVNCSPLFFRGVLPEVNPVYCIGCRGCGHVCLTKPYKVIFVDGNPAQKIARNPVMKKIEVEVDTTRIFRSLNGRHYNDHKKTDRGDIGAIHRL